MTFPVVVGLCATAVVLGYIIGCSRVTDRHEWLVGWCIGEQRKTVTALRMLYAATDYEYPEQDEDPQPGPSLWTRLWERVRAVVRRRPSVVQVPAEEPEPADPDSGFTPDPDPATEPFAQPDTGPPTVPGTEVVAQPFETWLADATADLDQRFAAAKAELYGTPTVRSE